MSKRQVKIDGEYKDFCEIKEQDIIVEEPTKEEFAEFYRQICGTKTSNIDNMTNTERVCLHTLYYFNKIYGGKGG